MAERFEFANNMDSPLFFDLNQVGNFGYNSVVSISKSGWGMPPVRHLSTRAPDQHGVTIRDTQYNSRSIQLGVHIRSEDRDMFYKFRRDILRRLRTEENVNGLLRYTFPDGVQREIECRFVGGLALPSQAERHAGRAIRDVLRFFCPSPFWYDPELKTLVLSESQSLTGSYPVQYPRSYRRVDIVGEGCLYNAGDVETFPRVVINGPGDRFLISKKNKDGTSSSIEIVHMININDQIVIDMGFGVRTVELVSGGVATNIYHNLSGQFWSMHLGENMINVDLEGSTLQSQVEISWYDRYLIA